MYHFIREDVAMQTIGFYPREKAFMSSLTKEADFKQYKSINDRNFNYIQLNYFARISDLMRFGRLPGYFLSIKFNDLLDQYALCPHQSCTIPLTKKEKVIADSVWYIYEDMSHLVDYENSVFSSEVRPNNIAEIKEKLRFNSYEDYKEYSHFLGKRAWVIWPTLLKMKQEAQQYDLLYLPDIRISDLFISDRLMKAMEDRSINGYKIVGKECTI